MRRIFILAILAATHLAGSAQTNPKIEALYDYLKAQGITKFYRLSNIDGDGLRKRFVVFLGLYDESRGVAPQSTQYYTDSLFNRIPAAGIDSVRNSPINGKKVKNLLIGEKADPLEGKVSVMTVGTKVDSAYRAKAVASREAYNRIRCTINELQEEAAESYSYEYHQNGADTIITTMALRNSANNNENIHSYRNSSNHVTQVVRAPERIYFNYYTNSKSASISPYAAVGYMNFQYDVIVDTTLKTAKDFNIAALQKKLAPIFKDKSIKRHELLCRHDATFDRRAYNDSLIRNGQYNKHIQEITTGSMGPGGESHYTIYKFTSEEKAKAVVIQVLQCVNQVIEEDPTQAFEVVSCASFGTSIPMEIFSAHASHQTLKDYHDGKREAVEMMNIKTYMDQDGFFVIVNVYKGDNTFPYEWKKLKSMVNGKLEYYKDSL